MGTMPRFPPTLQAMLPANSNTSPFFFNLYHKGRSTGTSMWLSLGEGLVQGCKKCKLFYNHYLASFCSIQIRPSLVAERCGFIHVCSGEYLGIPWGTTDGPFLLGGAVCASQENSRTHGGDSFFSSFVVFAWEVCSV